MKIPKSFKIAGHTITVRLDPNLLHDENSLGLAVYRDLEIVLQKPTKENPVPRSKLEEVFLHEKYHFLMWIMGNKELREDEGFIDLLATFSHQATITESVGEL